MQSQYVSKFINEVEMETSESSAVFVCSQRSRFSLDAPAPLLMIRWERPPGFCLCWRFLRPCISVGLQQHSPLGKF